jgi:hypothetical protein
VRIGAVDANLTPVSGMVAVTELMDRLGVIDRLDAAIGPIKTRRRGSAVGSCWSGWPWRSWPGKTSWSGWTANAPIPPDSC